MGFIQEGRGSVLSAGGTGGVARVALGLDTCRSCRDVGVDLAVEGVEVAAVP